MRGLPENWRYMGTPACLQNLWSRRLLRQFQEQTCYQAFPRHRTPHYAIHRTRRRLDVVLYRRGNSLMDKPVLILVDDEATALAMTDGELRKRYGADYEIICE